MDFSLSIEASDSGTATPNFSDADLLSKSPLLGKQHLHLQTSLSNSTSSETLNSSGGNTHSVSSPISHSDDLMMLGGGDRSNPSSGTSTPPLAIPGQHQHLAQTPFLSVSATLSASTSIQSLASVSSSVSCSASKRKAVPRRSLSLSESISDPDIVKLDVFDLFRRQPKRLLEEVEIIVESPPSSASSSSSEPPHVNPVRRVNSLPHMTSTEQQRWGSARGGEWSGDDASSVGSTQATLLSSSAPNKKRFYQKRTASPDDEDNDAEAGYHTRLPPMIDTTGYRESNAEIHSPALPSAASPHFSSDSLNPLSPTTNYRDYSDADEEAIAAARELGSLKIFGNIYGYDEPSSQGSNSGSKKNRRGSSASRRQPTNNRLPIRASSNDPDNLLSQSQEWGEDDMMDSENPNGASRAVNRSHYPPVSGRGSEGAFQTTQHMPKGQIRSVLVNNRFKDTAGKDVAHWKCGFHAKGELRSPVKVED